MQTTSYLRKPLWLGIVLVCALVLCPLRPSGASENQPYLDFDKSDPVEYTASIMEINYEKAELVVAEETILVVDFMIGAHRYATEVTDDSGHSRPFQSFQRGDLVFIKGFKNADGLVLASLIQKLDPREVKIKKGTIRKNKIKKARHKKARQR